MRHLTNNKGLASILEVIVSSIIFMTAAIGFFSSVSMLTPTATDSAKKLRALHAAKSVVDDLRAEVYGNLWTHASSPLRPNVVHQRTVGVYSINYILTDVPNITNGGVSMLRRMDMNVLYPN
jgi:hypothetical protein